MNNTNVQYRKNASWDIRLIELPLVDGDAYSAKERIVQELSRTIAYSTRIDIVEIKPISRGNKVLYSVGYALLEQKAS